MFSDWRVTLRNGAFFMCGICGLVGKNGAPADESVLQSMTQAIVHRGPDDDGHFVYGGAGLGFRRLSIVDLAHGHQPLSNEDGTVWIVFNGEIYNYKPLRDDLLARGHQFRTEADTEVIVHLYEEMGIQCVNQLRGMFAIAIYDLRKQELYLARDYFGIKPLYYADTEAAFVFGSEIKSLLASGYVKSEVSAQALWNFFTFQYVPDPDTMFAGIHKVPPGHYLLIREQKVSVHKYWQVEFHPDDSKSLAYFAEGITDRLRNSVQAHLTGDVPRGAFLSSGLDSTAIVSLMREREAVQTFSIGFEGAPDEQNELTLARETARYLGTDHHNVWINAARYQEELPRLVFYQEDPVADASAMALYFVSEVASSFVKVVLSGEGADELFAGYPIYHEPLSLRMFEYMPHWLRQALGRFAQVLPHGVKGKSFLHRGSLPLERRFVGNAQIFTEDAKAELMRLSGLGQVSSAFSITDPLYRESRHLDDVTRMQYVDVHTWLPGDILMKADKMTMANSLELRVPFLDKEVFEFASTIPLKYRLSAGTTKYALRQAMKGIVPEFVYNRPKLGFPVPIRHWLRKEMLDFTWDLVRSSKTEAFINRPYVERLIEEHVRGGRDHWREIWTVMNFMLWHQIFVEQSRSFVSGVSPRVGVRRRRMEELSVH